ncbi:MAG TPA: BON domain-containing protein [Candidatus Limnocylindria bacterium]|nr:BON domain-containing protein [Candidatus Limnocylindria bacterium]
MPRLLLAALAAALGAAAAFLLDPARGRARRARLVDQSAAKIRDAARGTRRTARLTASTVSGRLSALRGRRNTGETANDATLKERVESELLGDPRVSKGALNINAEQGIVVLRGEVPDEEMRSLLEERAGQVRGVWYVENLLHLPGEPAVTHR